MNNIRYFGPLHKIDKWLKKSAAMFVNSSSYAWCSGPTRLGDSEPIWRKRHYFKKIDLLAFLVLFGCPNLGEREETNIFNVKNPFCPLDCPPYLCYLDDTLIPKIYLNTSHHVMSLGDAWRDICFPDDTWMILWSNKYLWIWMLMLPYLDLGDTWIDICGCFNACLPGDTRIFRLPREGRQALRMA